MLLNSYKKRILFVFELLLTLDNLYHHRHRDSQDIRKTQTFFKKEYLTNGYRFDLGHGEN